MAVKDCPCGSGKPREEKFDGYGIHLCFVCDECETRKLAKFRPDIFERYEASEPIEPEDYYSAAADAHIDLDKAVTGRGDQ